MCVAFDRVAGELHVAEYARLLGTFWKPRSLGGRVRLVTSLTGSLDLGLARSTTQTVAYSRLRST